MGEATTNILSPFNPPVRTCCVEKNQTSTKVQFPLLVFSIEFRFPQNFTTQSFFIFFLSNLDSSANVQAFRTEVVKTHPTRVTFIISTCVTRGRAGNPRPRFTHPRDDKFQRGICALLVCEKLRWQLVYFIRFWKKKKKTPENSPQTGPSVNKCITLPWVNVLKWLKFFIVTHHV